MTATLARCAPTAKPSSYSAITSSYAARDPDAVVDDREDGVARHSELGLEDPRPDKEVRRGRKVRPETPSVKSNESFVVPQTHRRALPGSCCVRASG
jgi:hypothetical protein